MKTINDKVENARDSSYVLKINSYTNITNAEMSAEKIIDIHRLKHIAIVMVQTENRQRDVWVPVFILLEGCKKRGECQAIIRKANYICIG